MVCETWGISCSDELLALRGAPVHHIQMFQQLLGAFHVLDPCQALNTYFFTHITMNHTLDDQKVSWRDWVQWDIPIIPATQEAETGASQFESAKLAWDPKQKKKKTKSKRTGGMNHVVENSLSKYEVPGLQRKRGKNIGREGNLYIMLTLIWCLRLYDV
jgi:hypothetical protein